MEPSALYYRELLRDELTRRCRRNPRYSLRAFAKSLAVDVAALSRVLTGKGALSLRTAKKLVEALGCTAQNKRLFLDSVIKDLKARQLGRVAPELEVAEARIAPVAEGLFAQIADWQHFAVLELTFVEGFSGEPADVAAALGIDAAAAAAVMQRLVKVGLLTRSADGKLKKTENALHAKSAKLSTPALKRHQLQVLDLARAAVEGLPADRRAVTTLMLPSDPELLDTARQMIEDFSWQLCRHLTGGRRTEVLGLSVCLFPVTNSRSPSK